MAQRFFRLRDMLEEARIAAAQGRHADALRAHVWFHEHALEHAPALYGVRLSFALAAWVELGRVYPEALRVLETIREAKATALMAGPRSRDSFHDVAAIDHSLGRPGRTYELFLRLCDLDVDFAASCAGIAMEALVEARDFELAARFLPDAQAQVRLQAEDLNERVRSLRDADGARRDPDRLVLSSARAYADDVALVLAVREGVGRTEEARAIRAAAIDRVEDESVRGAVRDLLHRSAPQ